MEYWQECSDSTAILPSSASDVAGLQHEIGSFTSRANFYLCATKTNQTQVIIVV